MEAPILAISPTQATAMFGPMYHGTSSDLATIIVTGFDTSRSVNAASNGYPLEPYGLTGIAPPVHHLGYGSYFTTVKAVSKKFAGGTMKGQRAFYLDSKRVLKINFGAPNTMMKWWLQNGYTMTSDATRTRNVKLWREATANLTSTLQAKYDAVHFLGKGIRRLLDGDQVCVYNTDLIHVLDPRLATGLEIGAKVIHTQALHASWRGLNTIYIDNMTPDKDGNLAQSGAWRGYFRSDVEPSNGRYPLHVIPPPGMIGVISNVRSGPDGPMYDVKWQKGGVRYNYDGGEIQPYMKKSVR